MYYNFLHTKENTKKTKHILCFHSRGRHLCKFIWKKESVCIRKRVQLPQDWFGTQTWPPFHCFGTQIWPPWRHVKTQNLHRTHTIMYRSNRSFNMPPPGNPPGIWLFWNFLFKFPPTRAKMPFKCPTLGSIQVIKCPNPGDISQAQKWQKDGGNTFSCRTKYL